MQIGHIEGATITIGESQGYRALPLRVEKSEDGTIVQSSAWFPDPAELAALLAGAPIILSVLGAGHPPVLLYAGNVPSEPTFKGPVEATTEAPVAG